MYICPNCKEELISTGNSYKCSNNHVFDRASSGYVNLLSGGKSGNHGDSKEMLLSRRHFLSLGHYFPTVQQVCDMISSNTPHKQSIRLLDAGCGEAYYTIAIKKHLEKLGKDVCICALDVSKDAIKLASKAARDINFCVASINELPYANGTFDVVLSLFAPLNESEFSRVLIDNGILITVSPSENHLFEFKAQIYEKPLKNPPSTYQPKLFNRVSSITKEWSAALDNNADVASLFKMTPYYHKSSPTDIEKALSLSSLKTTVGFNYELFTKYNV